VSEVQMTVPAVRGLLPSREDGVPCAAELHQMEASASVLIEPLLRIAYRPMLVNRETRGPEAAEVG
jgi:hypothetical protein